MAKSRKHGGTAADRRDRLLGTYRCESGCSEYGGAELSEEDVWSIAATEDAGIDGRWSASTATVDRYDRRLVVGGLSVALDVGGVGREAAAAVVRKRRSAVARWGRVGSAPVSVPRWRQAEEYGVSAEELGGDEEKWVAPHEYLAREHAAAAASVLEGVGRTLKGRDMRRVRDAVWSQTGFFG